jgi:hypothetical protein
MPETPSETTGINVSELEQLKRDEKKRYRCPVCGTVYEQESLRDLCVAQHIQEWLGKGEVKAEEAKETAQEPRLKAEFWERLRLKPGNVVIVHVGQNRIRGIVLAVDANNIYLLNIDNCALEIVGQGRYTRITIPPRSVQIRMILQARRPVSEIMEALKAAFPHEASD